MPKRVLLLIPEFYGIENKIIALLRDSGYEVESIQNKDLRFDYKGRISKFKLLRRLYFYLFFPRERYIYRELKNINNLHFDIIFSVNCQIICPYLFNRLKNINPGVFSILYLWDSFSKYSWENRISLFDKVYTFDHLDSEKYKIEYKPNFYVSTQKKQESSIKFELSFAGKFSPERFQIIEKLQKQLADSNIRHSFFLWPAYKNSFHNNLLYSILKHFGPETKWVGFYILTYEINENILKRDYITAARLCYEDVQLMHMASNVILDLPFEHQSGYTHRLIEALANGKKIITTNSKIRDETYFNPEQICLIDSDNPVIDLNWVFDKKEFASNSNFDELELSKWLNSILINARVA